MMIPKSKPATKLVLIKYAQLQIHLPDVESDFNYINNGYN